MARKFPAIAVLVLAAVAVAMWWRAGKPAGVPQEVAHASKQSASASSKPAEAGAIASAVKPVETAGVKLWSAATSTEGQRLDPKSATANSGNAAHGRTAYFDASSVIALKDLQRGSVVTIPLPGGESVTGRVNLVLQDSNGTVRVGGALDGGKGSFSLTQTQDAHGLAGRILQRDLGKAYVLFAHEPGRVAMQETALSEVVCYPYPKELSTREQSDGGTVVARPRLPEAIVPALQSRPGAAAVLYLDFDGATVTDPDWNDGVTIIAPASTLNNAEITEVWNRVKEDYAPFNINITTVESDYSAAAVNSRMRVIITSNDVAAPGAGGVAWTESFAGKTQYGFTNDVPAWVFNFSPDGIAEAISHELGHTLGLSHDGRTSPAEEYYTGHGSGATSWAPIMGAGYSCSLVQWSKGEYLGANNPEDDVAIISGLQPETYSASIGHPLYNGTGYIPDDAGDTRGLAAALGISGNTINQSGIISSASDVDFYSFTLGSSQVITLTASPANTYPKQANLDISLELQDGGGNVLTGSNPDQSLDASLSYPLSPGTYYIKIQGSGRGSPQGDGYSNYGSTGHYQISGTFSVFAAPSITGQPAPRSAAAGATVLFAVSAAGYPLPSYQWQRLPAGGSGTWTDLGEGGNYSGTTGSVLTVSGLTLGMNGDQFRCIASNSAGSVSSIAVALTVTAPQPPAIAAHPASASVTTGDFANFSVVTTGSAPLSYQWQRLPAGSGTWSALSNGGSYSGTTTATLIVATSLGMNGDQFRCVVTNVAGSATSNAATLTVGATPPPSISSQPDVTSTTMGGNANLYISVNGSGYTFQWYHNGVAIPGATQQGLSLPNATVADAGEYFVAVANSAGVVLSRTVTLRVGLPGFGTRNWIDATVVDGVAYFLFSTSPRIERYDLAAETWLGAWTLPSTPKAFTFSSNAIYVATGANVLRYNRDFTGATTFITGSNTINGLTVAGANLVTVAADGSYNYFTSYQPGTGQQISALQTFGGPNIGISYSPSTRQIFARDSGRSPADIYVVTVGTDGTFSARFDSPYHGSFPGASRTFVVGAGDLVADDAGVVYHASDLTYAYAMGGVLDDLLNNGTDGCWILRDGVVSATDSQFRETGVFQLSVPAGRIFKQGNALFGFAPPATAGALPAVQKIDLSQIQPPAGAAAVNPVGRTIWSPKVMMGDDGIVAVYSKVDRNVFRWDPQQWAYLPAIPLSSSTDYLTAGPAGQFAFARRGYQVRMARPGAPEQAFFSATNEVRGLQSINQFFFLSDYAYNSYHPNKVLSAAGVLLSGGGDADPREFAWNPVLRRVYQFRDSVSPNDLVYNSISETGELLETGDSPYHGDIQVKSPIRVSPDGTQVALGTGQIYQGMTLLRIGDLGNAVDDIAWAGGQIHTIRAVGGDTQVQSWSAGNYQATGNRVVSGLPVRLLTIKGDRLLLITTTNGQLNYHLLSSKDRAEVDPTVVAAPAVIVSQPGDMTLTVGAGMVFEVSTIGGAVPSYQWQVLSGGASAWRNLADSTDMFGTQTGQLVFRSVGAEFAGAQFRVVVTNAGGTTTGAPFFLNITGPGAVSGVSAGGDSTLFWRTDGSLWASGFNGNGQLGDGTTNNHTTSVQVASSVVRAATNGSNSFILKSDGTLWATGTNAYGQLGDGTTNSRTSLTQVATDVIAFAGGGASSFFLKKNGTLWAVGYNGGALGDGTSNNRLVPVQVATDVIDCQAGGGMSMFLKVDGSLWTTGSNTFGQLGQGTTNSNVYLPQQVATNVRSFGAGGINAYFIKNDGSLWVMGDNRNGQFGNGTTTNSNAPLQVAVNVAQAAIGDSLFFVKTDGSLWGAGSDAQGQLGNGPLTYSNQLGFIYLMAGARGVSAGADFTMVTKTDGSLWAAGYFGWGQFGIGDSVSTASFNSSVFVRVSTGLWSAPVAPSGLVAEADPSGRGIWLSWLPSLGANSYEVWRNTTNNSATATLLAGGLVNPIYLDTTTSGVTDYYYWIKAANPGATGQFGGASSTHNGPPTMPSIAGQPVSVVVPAGQSASFTVTATGGSLSYQWRKGGSNLSNGGSISGATSPALRITGVVKGDEGNYDVVVANIAGSVTSNVATLTVTAPPEISARPSSRVVAVGGSTSLGVTVSYATSYVWKHDGVVVSGATTSALDIPSAAPADRGMYELIATNTYGSTRSLVYLNVAGTNTVSAWGDNSSGQTSVPGGLVNLAQISAGVYHTLALKSDGTVAAWGANTNGQCTMPIGLTNVVAVSAGRFHSVALKSDGTVVAWGLNDLGQCNVPGGLTNVVWISAGGSHTLALKSDGTIVGWGDNTYGQTTIPAGLSATVTGLAAGMSFNVAANEDGTVTTWGRNDYGQTSVPVGLTNVVRVEAGAAHALAQKADGTIVAWGRNDSGQTVVPGGLANVQQLDSLGNHTLALKADGTIVAWGNNASGQATVPGALASVQQVAAGSLHSVALVAPLPPNITVQPPATLSTPNGTGAAIQVIAAGAGPITYAWQVAPPDNSTWSALADNANYTGTTTNTLQLMASLAMNGFHYRCVVSNAVGSVNSSTTTLTVTDLPVISAQPLSKLVTAGATTSLDVVAGNATGYVWKRNGAVIAGATTATLAIPSATLADQGLYEVTVSNANGSVRSLVYLNVATSNTVIAWGDNSYGQTVVPGGVANLAQVSAGVYHTVALKDDGTVVAWGANTNGQCSVPAGLSNVVAVSAGRFHTVALKGDGTVVTWGLNDLGQCTVPGGLSSVVWISAGGSHTLAMKSDGTILGWGDNTYGQTTIPAGLSATVAGVAAGMSFNVAVKNDGTVATWGRNDYGQTTIPTGLANVVMIEAGAAHALAIKADGTMVAWGRNDSGQTAIPSGLLAIRQADSLGNHTLALQVGGTVAAWGNNASGQTTIPNGVAAVQQVAAGALHSVAVVGLAMPTTPLINTQPTNQTVVAGINASFFVGASGFPSLSYQWRKGGVNLSNGGAISGATTATLTIANTQVGDAGSYDVVVTNLSGTTTSNSVTLTVNAGSTPPAVSVRPLSKVVAVGGNTSLDITAVGATGYAWKHNGVVVTGVTTNTLSIANATLADRGLYEVTAINTYGSVRSLVYLSVAGTNTVSAWGDNSSGQTNVPAGLANLAQISAGVYHTLALKGNGTVAAWGANTNGQCSVPGTLSNVVAVSAGRFHSVALKGDGTVVAWGLNDLGQCNVPAGLSNVVWVSAGGSHTLALKADGTIVGWGDNSYGQTTTPAGLSATVTGVAAGMSYNVAVKSDGTVTTWGNNDYGQTVVPGGLSNVVRVEAGAAHTLAIKANGTVVAWGRNDSGQTAVPGGLTTVQQVDSLGNHTLALKADGSVVAWGNNANGQATVPGGLANIQQVAAGALHSIALVGPVIPVAPTIATQTPWQQTFSGNDAVFNATVTGSPTSFQWQRSTDSGTSWTALTNGGAFSGVTTSTLTVSGASGSMTGWMFRLVATNSIGSTTGSPALLTILPTTGTPGLAWSVGAIADEISFGPVTAPKAVAGNVTAISTGTGHSLFIKTDGTLWATGDNVFGQLGDGTTVSRNIPVSVASGVTAVAAGGGHTVFLKSDGTVWGMGSLIPSQPSIATPAQIGLSGVTAVAAGYGHTIFLKDNGTAWAMGDNSFGQLGDGTTTLRALPVQIATGVAAIAAGGGSTFLVKTDGTLWAAGRNSDGDLGDGTTTQRNSLVQVATGVAMVAGGSAHACFVKTDGTLWTMGSNFAGQLGDGTTTAHSTPMQIATGVVTADAGSYHTLFRKTDGTLWAAGHNFYGQLGDGTQVSRATPVQVASGVAACAVGGDSVGYSLFVKTDGTLWGMGAGSKGELGDGQSAAPIALLASAAKSAAGMFSGFFAKTDGTLWQQVGNQVIQVPGVSGVVSVSAGTYDQTRVYLKTDGTLWKLNWDGTSTQVASRVISAGAGTDYFAYLKTDGTLWGQGGYASSTGLIEFGDGVSPVQVADHVKSFSTAGWHMLFVKDDQTLWGIGQPWGTFGDAYSPGQFASTPVQLETSVVSATANVAQNLYIKTDGTLWTRGEGWGSAAGPAAQVDGNVIAAVPGVYETYYLKTDGTLWLRPGIKGTLGATSQITGGVVALVDGGGGYDGSTLFLQGFGYGTVPSITEQPASSTPAYGAAVTLQVTASGTGPMEYQWYRNGVPLARGRNAQYTVSFATLSDDATYTVTVRNSAGLVTSDTATLTVTGAPTPPALSVRPLSQVVAVGGSMSLSISASGATSYAWKHNGAVLAGATTNTLSIANATLADRGLYEVTATNTYGSTRSLVYLNVSGTNTVSAWGDNSNGQTSVPGGLANLAQISAGVYHNLALQGDGTVAAWGANTNGQCSVPGTLSNVVAVSAGRFHSVALKGDGTVVAWGLNDLGQCSVPGGLSNVVWISAGGSHTLALKSDGTIVGWGDNTYGQTTIPAGLSGAVAGLAAGMSFSVAVKSDGTVATWGRNDFGQTTIPGGLADVVRVEAGAAHALAQKADGTIVAWGRNDSGQTLVPGGLTNVSQVDSLGNHTLALKADGSVVAWGNNASGQATVPGGLANVQQVAAGALHSVVLVGPLGPQPPTITNLSSTRNVLAPGENLNLSATATGTGTLSYQWSRNGRPVSGATSSSFAITNATYQDAGYYLVRVTNSTGTTLSKAIFVSVAPVTTQVRAWGNNSTGVNVPADLTDAIALASGAGHSVALKRDGTVVALAGDSITRPVPAGLNGVVAIAASYFHSLALKSDGTVVGWGNNGSGETTIPAGLNDVVAISAGSGFSVALRSDGTVVTWGYNNYGQSNVPAGLTNVVGIAAGSSHVLALKGDGTIVGWGNSSALPTSVPAGLTDVARIYAGYLSSMALKNDGTVVAWGTATSFVDFTSGVGIDSIAPGSESYHYLLVLIDGTVAFRGIATPGTAVPAGIGGVFAASCGQDYFLALRDATGAGSPAITARPLSQVVAVGGSTSLGITASGATSYAWKHNGVVVAGAATNTLNIPNATLADRGLYEVIATNGNGSTRSLVYLNVAGTNTVSAWGDNSSGQTSVPGGLANLVQISAGVYHTLALKSDGTVAAWGANTNGQSTIPIGLTNVVAVSAGRFHSVALKSDGTVAAWGLNDLGQCTVPGGLNNVVWVSAGGSHTLALKSDGTIVGWGDNTYGQTTIPAGLNATVTGLAAGMSFNVAANEDGTVTTWGRNDYGQTTVPGGLTNVVRVEAGAAHALAQKADGTIVAWGRNDSGQTAVPGGLTNVSQVDSLGNHTLALKSDGSVVAWGNNASGQATVPGGLANVQQVAAGALHSVALVGPLAPQPPTIMNLSSTRHVLNPGQGFSFDLTASGTGPLAYQWRHNGRVISGATGTNLSRSGLTYGDAGWYDVVITNSLGETRSAPIFVTVTPAQTRVVAWGYDFFHQSTVPTGLTDVIAVSGGGGHTLALRSNGSIVGWGESSYYAALTTAPGEFVAVCAGYAHSLALRADGTVVCANGVVPAGLNQVVALAAGYFYSYALKADGTVVSWDATNGNLLPVRSDLQDVVSISAVWQQGLALKNDGTIVDIESSPAYAPGSPPTALAVGLGGSFASALKADGTVVSWGDNSDGAASVPAGLANVRAISLGFTHQLALKADGTVVAWGNNAQGQTSVPAGLANVWAISAGNRHSVALRDVTGEFPPSISVRPLSQVVAAGGSTSLGITASEATSYAWKRNGAVVAGATTNTLNIPNATLADRGLYEVIATNGNGSTRSLVYLNVAGTNTVRAWGDNSSGQTSVPGGLANLAQISAGVYHTLALKSDGTVAAWGANTNGQCTMPIGLTNVVAVSAGRFHSVALKSDGTVVAWGLNDLGQCNVPGGLTNVVWISAGGSHTLALKSDGTIVGWGDNTYGQTTIPAGLSATVTGLAAGMSFNVAANEDGTVTTWGRNDYGQTTIPSGLVNVVKVEAGAAHVLAQKADGTVVAWGRNDSGQTAVPGGLANVTQMDSLGNHTLALKADGSVVAWGNNASGQATIPGGLGTVQQVAAGALHSVVLTSASSAIAESPAAIPLAAMTEATPPQSGNGTTGAMLPAGNTVGGSTTVVAGVTGSSGSGNNTISVTGSSLSVTEIGVTVAGSAPRNVSLGTTINGLLDSWTVAPKPALLELADGSPGDWGDAFKTLTSATNTSLRVDLVPGPHYMLVQNPNDSRLRSRLQFTVGETTGDDTMIRITSLAVVAEAGPDKQTLEIEFAVTGSSPQKILITAAGLAAGTPALSDPALDLLDEAGKVVAQNDDWRNRDNAVQIAGALSGTGALANALGEKDAALLLGLKQGRYTARLTAVRSGMGLLEIQRVP